MKISLALWVFILILAVLVFAPRSHADPNVCPDTGGNVNTYTTFVPCPRWHFLPEQGGGNNRWTDGTDD